MSLAKFLERAEGIRQLGTYNRVEFWDRYGSELITALKEANEQWCHYMNQCPNGCAKCTWEKKWDKEFEDFQ